MKKCKLCKTLKPDSEYYVSKGYVSQPCIVCVCAQAKLRRSNKPQKIRVRLSKVANTHARNMSSIKYVYNLTEDKLQEMLLAQQGCCKICGVDFGVSLVNAKYGRTYDIEHNHDTGKIRGLFCRRCNVYQRYEDANLKR